MMLTERKYWLFTADLCEYQSRGIAKVAGKRFARPNEQVSYVYPGMTTKARLISRKNFFRGFSES